ncbi:unnamed protein product [Microthlaspi erraticum]|uniref:F-box domain-containing protein n=1 Tax=Microthlaspi erraticum TaxID=1685480 RepID=A0A6D2JPI9_9BRAS|nr:unnamed protein product [Microthlaspi erraticum]
MDPEENKTTVLEFILSSSSKSSLESTIFSFLSCPDSALFSNNFFFECLSPCDDNHYVKDQLIHRTLRRLLLLLESTKRCSRKQLTLHNSISWFLPPDLTIKVFSMLDTKSLMQVAACCTMFNKSAMEPLCYSHIDLTTAFAHADDGVVRTMIQRAGKELRSLKLGRPPHQNEYATVLLSAYCLAPLSPDMGFTGVRLRSLHLYSITWLNEMSLCTSLSACSNLFDLKIVEFNGSLELVLKSLARKCRLIEHLFLETSFGDDCVTTESTIDAFVTNCSNLTSLTLKDFYLNDQIARILVKGFRKLKYMNLSRTFGFDGSFLRSSCKNSLLETLILRDCSLKEREVLEFFNSLVAGNFRFIRYIDVSRKNGLICDGDTTSSEPNFPLEKLKKERPYFKLVAEFPTNVPREMSRYDYFFFASFDSCML